MYQWKEKMPFFNTKCTSDRPFHKINTKFRLITYIPPFLTIRQTLSNSNGVVKHGHELGHLRRLVGEVFQK